MKNCLPVLRLTSNSLSVVGREKVALSPLGIAPDLLNNLITAPDRRGKKFRSHLRANSSSLALCSLEANYDKELVNAKKAVYTFRIR